MDKQALGTAIAGGAIAAALIERLFDKGVLSLDDARGVLDSAMRPAGRHAHSEGGYEASQIIASMMRGKFSARRGEP
jgi:hypothetical protein